jgi:hypothetical protein
MNRERRTSSCGEKLVSTGLIDEVSRVLLLFFEVIESKDCVHGNVLIIQTFLCC